MKKTAMIEITQLASAAGPLTKRIHVAPDGCLKSDGSACVMANGIAKRLILPTIEAFAEHIANLETNMAIALGALRPDLPDEVQVITQQNLTKLNGSAAPNVIARTAGHIAYRANKPALALIDIDTKGMPANVVDNIKSAGGYWAALVSVVPELAAIARAIRTSTSSGISRTDTGAAIKGSNGVHVFLLVQDGADIERFLRTLHDRCWLAGFGWMMIGAGGQFLERSLIDRTVYAAERLVFEAAPILVKPLVQDPARRMPKVENGEPADTRSICQNLSAIESAKLRELRIIERARLADDATTARQTFVTIQTARIAKKTGCDEATARKAVERQTGGILSPCIVLPFDDDDMEGATVADVLADPARFVGATLADPLEGIEYGKCKAKIMRRPDGSLWVNSFAHGRTTYELRHDAASVEAALKAATPKNAADLFIRLLLVADLAADEEQALRSLVQELSGVKARPLDAKIKAARKEHAEASARAEAERQKTARTDKRLQIPVPSSDDERLPVLRLLDDALTSSSQDVPPMRDLDGHPIEIRCRPPMMLHELTAQGANQGEAKNTRLPPPIMPLLTRHDRYSLAHEIEHHIEFVVESDTGVTRAVALPGTFVEHFMAYRDSRLPRVGAVVTAPLVMSDGSLLAPKGLDLDRKLVFQIEPQLMSLMPKPQDCTKQAAADALDYLATKWLCDVATDFSGKCVLIALALTILQRVLFPERPAFFITAGKRGGGKTTAIMMIILAVTGKKPPASAWSPSEEERRKAILSYLAEGLAALVWDNIPLGSTISCPTLEKVLTAETFSDRLLGQSSTITVPAFTIMIFTGNNIAPKGDTASRSLMARLEVDRPDPENRKFTHADPVAWTLANRGAILRALYVILLANPQLREAQPATAKTRFKTWWKFVGSAVEHAAGALVDDQFPIDEDKQYASRIDFAKLFALVEGDDEDGTALADALDMLNKHWPDKPFQASDVANLINGPMAGEDDAAAVLRGYFETNSRRPGMTITPRSIGQRLAAMVGAPVFVGQTVMRLDRVTPTDTEKNKRAVSFRVCRP